jgi:ABC-type sugar transport system ATPase subunit
LPQTNLLLEVESVSKSYFGIQALKEVNFNLQAGEVHALVGENGAGKSTLVKIITGVIKNDGGQIKINGQPVKIKNPHHARELGVAVIFQELSQIPSLSVAENVFLGNEPVKSGLLDRAAMIRQTNEILHKYGIDLDPSAQLSDLSAAQRQLAEIVKAISRKPKILIMDEPTSTLSDIEAESVFKIVDDLKKAGAGIIYVSHRMDEIFLIANRITVLRDGSLIGDYPASELDLNKVVKLMVGREVEIYESTRAARPPQEKIKLQVKDLCKKGVFNNISFDLYEGEILGIVGLVGSGRSELAEAVFGVGKIDSGQIMLNGKKVKISSVADAMNLGIALLPESRHTQGLVLNHTVGQNMTLTVLKKFAQMGVVNYKNSSRLITEKIDELDIRPKDAHKLIRFLSGGNQQKVVLAKWLLTKPQILIVDEPTVGIDIHAKSEIHRLIRKLAKSGVSIIMISSDMPELLAHGDRLLVMNNGRIIGAFQQTTQEKIMSLIMKDVINDKMTACN